MNLVQQANPWRFFDQLQRERYTLATNKLDKQTSATEPANWTPSVDIHESETAYILAADLPGMTPENIDISTEKGVLTIQGERTIQALDNSEKPAHLERKQGAFFRRFTLPESADIDAISAKYENGVLTINIPKQEVLAARKIEVKH